MSIRPRRPIPILVYHQIALAPPKGAPFRGLYVSPVAFARQMTWLAHMGWRGLSMPDLMPYLRGERQGRVFGITLDDGYENNLTDALPVLQRLGFTSTCYIVSQHVGQSNVWDETVGIAPARLMNATQLRAWVQGGQDIGAHTRHHVHLGQVPDATASDEIAACKGELEAIVQQPVQHFCYPYGEYEPHHVQAVQMAGFASATTTERGRVHAGDDALQLPRVPVLRTTSLPLLWWKMTSHYEDRKRRAARLEAARAERNA